MQTKPKKVNNLSNDRLREIGCILAKGIYRLKQREAKERENGVYDPMVKEKIQKNVSLSKD